MKGDIDRREIKALHGRCQCPSLTGRHEARFRRPGSRSRGWWQLASFDVATNEERVLDKETRSVDDQVEWLDNQTVMYHLTGSIRGRSGRSPGRIIAPKLLFQASPAVVMTFVVYVCFRHAKRQRKQR